MIKISETERIMSKIIRFSVGDTLEMKKKHPCGAARFKVMRTGSDVRIVCEGCGRDLSMPRVALERSIKKVIPSEVGDKDEG
jgi:hypothetical protein